MKIFKGSSKDFQIIYQNVKKKFEGNFEKAFHKMDRGDINTRLNLALDNILDVVPLIDNTGEADAPLNFGSTQLAFILCVTPIYSNMRRKNLWRTLTPHLVKVSKK